MSILDDDDGDGDDDDGDDDGDHGDGDDADDNGDDDDDDDDDVEVSRSDAWGVARSDAPDVSRSDAYATTQHGDGRLNHKRNMMERAEHCVSWQQRPLALCEDSSLYTMLHVLLWCYALPHWGIHTHHTQVHREGGAERSQGGSRGQKERCTHAHQRERSCALADNGVKDHP